VEAEQARRPPQASEEVGAEGTATAVRQAVSALARGEDPSLTTVSSIAQI
jgi:hypothetical protein